MKVLGVIPARYASSRFPGKPLVMIEGKSMIRRVYEQAMKSRLLSGVIVATDDSRISEHVKGFQGEVMLTSTLHVSGTERIGEVIRNIEQTSGQHYDVIVNIQGDEPRLNPEQIDQAVGCFEDTSVQISSLMKLIQNPDEISNPNVVKVVVDKNSDALYFSRSAIPFIRDIDSSGWISKKSVYKHVGIYAYRIDILKQILVLPPSSLEKAESLEQLRWLENGFKIRVVPTQYETVAVDTPEDLLKLTNKI